MKILHQDIRDAIKMEYDYIGHQCNCSSTTAHGVAPLLFAIWPEAHYQKTPNREFGSVKAFSKEGIKTQLVNMYTQQNPGAAKFPHEYPRRLDAFDKALEYFRRMTDAKIAIPYLIGCGLAKGDWRDYEMILLKHDKILTEGYGSEITLFKI